MTIARFDNGKRSYCSIGLKAEVNVDNCIEFVDNGKVRFERKNEFDRTVVSEQAF